MSFTEVLVAISGLAIGYWLVAVFLPHSRQPPGEADTSGDDDEGPATRAAGAPSHWSEVLGVSQTASREEIVAAYKAKISQYHPDKVATMADEIREIAQRRSASINAAYDEAMRRFR